MQDVVEVQYLLAFALHEFGHGDTRPTGYDARDFLLGHRVAQQGVLCGRAVLLRLLQLFLQFGQAAVFELCGCLVIADALCRLDFAVDLFDFRFRVGNDVDARLLVVPLRLHGVELVAQLGKLLLQSLQTLFREGIRLLFERHFFDFQLHDFAGDVVHFGGH